MIKINDETAIRKHVIVQERSDGVKSITLPKVFDENGAQLGGGDEVDLCFDKTAGIVYFSVRKEKPGESSAAQSVPDGAGVQE